MFRIDHFILAVSSIADGGAHVHSLTGVKPEFGGFHPSYGTCNSILSLNDSYFELLALDPDAIDPQTRFLPTFREMKAPKVVSWAVSYDNEADVIRLLKKYDLSLSEVKQGKRTLPSGEMLKYEFATIVGLNNFVDIMPFFIKWKSQLDHPSANSPKGCRLKQFKINYPSNAGFKGLITDMHLGVILNENENPNLKVVLETPEGDVSF